VGNNRCCKKTVKMLSKKLKTIIVMSCFVGFMARQLSLSGVFMNKK
jgi:hypothetical protein